MTLFEISVHLISVNSGHMISFVMATSVLFHIGGVSGVSVTGFGDGVSIAIIRGI